LNSGLNYRFKVNCLAISTIGAQGYERQMI
jgi:hypothetical protein